MTTEFGYTGKMLRVDLSSGSTSDITTGDYAERFLGGKGIAAKLYWDEVPPDTGAFDAENRLIFMTGPLTGVAGLASSRLEVYGKSPVTTPEHFSYASLGGSWGPYLKFAGYDGIMVQGKSDRPVYLFLHDGICELRDASHLWGKGALEVRGRIKEELGAEVKVLTTGIAGDNMVIYASFLADNDSCGTGGLAAVMGSKKLKAIAVSGSRRIAVADPQRLHELNRHVRGLKKGPANQPQAPLENPKMTRQLCWGCIGGCMRATYRADNGRQGKFICQAGGFYQALARKHYGEGNDVPFLATKLCDDYGLDTRAISAVITWLVRCEQAGILSEECTGIPLSKAGSLEFIESLVRKISLKEGFGEILSRGTLKAAGIVGNGAEEQMADYPFKAENQIASDPRIYVTTGLLHMVEPRPVITVLHEVGGLVFQWLEWLKNGLDVKSANDLIRNIAREFHGGELAVDFSVYEGKARAAKVVQDRAYANGCLILCDLFWPMRYLKHSENQVGDPTIESKLVSAVIGDEYDEEALYRVGERVFNLQRAILTREGHQGRESDTLPDLFYTVPLETDSRNTECLVPGKGDQVISKKGEVLDRERFEALKSEYYALRGWDVATGRPTRARLSELGLTDIAVELERTGLFAGV